MLVIHIPTGQTRGQCRIFGLACEFRIKETEFAFRRLDREDWERRDIVVSIPRGKQTAYTCSE